MTASGLHARVDTLRMEARIVDAALDLIDAFGFPRMQLPHVAARAGLSVHDVERRFDDKYELLGTIVDQLTDDHFWSAHEGWVPDPRTKLVNLLHQHLLMLREDERACRVVLRWHGQLREPYRESWERRTAAYVARWVAPLREYSPDLDGAVLEARVKGAIGMLNALVTRFPGDVNPDRDARFARAACDVLKIC